MTTKQIFLPFAKRDDAKRLVYGYATTEAIDSMGESISKTAVEGALTDYMKFANIREMHQNSAVGVAKTANMDSKGLYLCAKIVDDEAWKKVVEGVYKGFSVGGKALEKTENIITRMKLTEISVVDRPANPEAVFDLWKADNINTRSISEMKTNLKKSLGLIEWAARILADLDCFRRAMQMDNASEGIHAGSVAEVDAVVSAFGAVTVKITSEEIAELGAPPAESAEVVAEAAPPAEGEVAAADKPADVAKAKTVALLTKEEMKAMRDMHVKLGEMLDAADKDASDIAAAVEPKKEKKPADGEEKPEEKPEEGKDKKAEGEGEEKPEPKEGEDEEKCAKCGELKSACKCDKLAAEAAELQKVEGLISKAVEPLKAENAKLQAELADIKKRAAPAKAAVTSVAKADDVNANAVRDNKPSKAELIAKGDTNALLDDAFANPITQNFR